MPTSRANSQEVLPQVFLEVQKFPIIVNKLRWDECLLTIMRNADLSLPTLQYSHLISIIYRVENLTDDC